MPHQRRDVTRRSFLATGGLGAMAAAAVAPGRALAAQPTADEQANITVVNGFCGAFVVPLDWARVTSFLTDDCKYRASQESPMVEGPDAIVALLRGFVDTATLVEFELVDTWARGPVVVNDRVDRFTLPDRSLDIPVVGVFHLIDGKIAEWTDFVFDFEF